jgi:hypothetical protein
MIAACLPSVRPLLKACRVITQTHVSRFTASKPTRMISSSDSQHSLKTSRNRELHDETALELRTTEQPPQAKDQWIQVKHDIVLERDRAEPGAPDAPDAPSYSYHVR